MSPLFATPDDLNAAEIPPALNGGYGPLSDLATRQHGVAARWQLLELGYSQRWIDHAMQREILHFVHDSVYAVGHAGLSRRGKAIAALLRAGGGSALSHESAARAWGLVGMSNEGPIHVSLGRRRGLESNEIVTVHRPRTLEPTDIVLHRGVPVTTPERTIRDCLDRHSVEEITRMLEQAVTVLGMSPDALHAWARTQTHIRGKTKLLRAMDNVVGPAILRSEFEREFRSLCQRAGLPLPETNAHHGRWELDAFWQELAVAVELDSWRWHGGRWQFHRDRRKGLALNRAGIELVRLTWAQVKYEEQDVVDTLRIVLGRAEQRRVLLRALS